MNHNIPTYKLVPVKPSLVSLSSYTIITGESKNIINASRFYIFYMRKVPTCTSSLRDFVEFFNKKKDELEEIEGKSFTRK